ncbi:amidohydrolase family protein [Duganella sp. LX20W]|uniref:Amidohydrolase family protein n=1 Tax=Rugamonas brunnea TaxID=2758569 RepID=A0A7W2IDN8_9BURK|nr:amidohydrolase family protein [Rugamonas brunnea]MBA5639465.1 amidohydrolase family protein [Rugamonas brunnea]
MEVLPVRAIDVHAHFFNASDIDAAGYLAHSVGHSTPELQGFIIAMEPVVRAVTEIASSAKDEYELLRDANTRTDGRGTKSLEDRAMEQRQRIEKRLREEIVSRGVDIEYDKAQVSLERKWGARFIPRRFNSTTVHKILDEMHSPGARGRMDQLRGVSGSTPDGIIRFVACMLQDRWMNLDLYRRTWEPMGIAAAFGAMVNFDYRYCASRSTPHDQMLLMALISKMSGGYMLPLIAYNPMTDLNESGASLALVQEAVNHHGFIGVKIYPPMGFKPYGNGVELDRLLLKMFKWCAEQRVPVMAHANRSMGYDNEADNASSPTGWQTLADAMAPSLPMRVNLGHLGGDGSEGDPTSWTRDFAQLMSQPKGTNTYGDLGYWTGLRACIDATCEPLERIKDALNVFPDFGRHVMYGSDWFMMIKEDGWQDYPTELARALAFSNLDRQAVFRTNAIECFGLNDKTRLNNLIEHLGKPPSWLT